MLAKAGRYSLVRRGEGRALEGGSGEGGAGRGERGEVKNVTGSFILYKLLLEGLCFRTHTPQNEFTLRN